MEGSYKALQRKEWHQHRSKQWDGMEGVGKGLGRFEAKKEEVFHSNLICIVYSVQNKVKFL